MDINEKPSESTVIEGVTDGDTPAALAYVAPSTGAAFLPPASQDAPVNQVIQPQVSDHLQIASQQVQKLHQQQQLQAFWSGELAKIEQATDFKTHSLPLGRIKKIMKADETVQRIAGEAPALIAKACEMFIQELTLRAWHHAEENKRRTLRKNDITEAIAKTELFDFLVPSDELKGDGLGLPPPPPPPAVQDKDKDNDDSYENYYGECDCFCPSSPDEPGPDLSNVTCDDPRYYTYIHEYYSL
ncbi:hypothetical protein ACP70R_002932 [Stipagrostis hirtigluma subsp. patula]